MDEIISRFSLKSLTSSVSLPVHDPITFGFEEMVRSKADNAKVRQELINIGKSAVLPRSTEDATDKVHAGYIYDYNVLAEISELKRKKNRK